MSNNSPKDTSHGRALPFITITQDNFQRGRPRQDPHVRRHVMLDHRRRERLAATERYQREQREKEAAIAEAAATSSSSSSAHSVSGSGAGNTAGHLADDSMELMDHSMELVQQHPAAARPDPFNSFANPVTADLHAAIEFYAKVMVPSTRPSDLQQDNPRTHGIIHDVLLGRLFVDSFTAAMTIARAMNVYATESTNMSRQHGASGASARSMLREDRQSSAQSLMAKGLAYMTRSMDQLNRATADKTLTSSTDNIATLLQLLVCDILLGETTRGEIHCTGLRTMVELRGGLHALGSLPADTIIISDMHMATMTHRQPQYPLIHALEQALSTDLAEACTTFDVTTWRHEPLILHPDLVQQLTHQFYSAFVHLQDIVNYTNTFQRPQPPPVPPPIRQMYISKTLAVEHAILSLIPKRRPDHRRTTSHHQTFSIISTLLFIYTAIQKWSPYAPLVRILVRQLHSTLSSETRRTDLLQTDPNFYLWALFVGAHASAGQTTRPWFIEMASEGVATLGLSEWAEVRAALCVGFYVEAVFDGAFEAVWHEIEHEIGIEADADNALEEEGRSVDEWEGM